MKALKVLAIVLGIYVVIVAAFETWLGKTQPQGGDTIVIHTQDAGGESHSRVVVAIHYDDKLYVAANHWPRRWYREVLAHPAVTVTADAMTQEYVAVPVTGDEFDRVAAVRPLGPVMRILTGFPPRRIVRLDPA